MILYKGRYPKKDLVRSRFGRLIVLSFEGRNRGTKPYWRCLCECGNETVVLGRHLISEGIKSCGCLRKERLFVHGMTGTKIYKVWRRLRQRCNNPKESRYHRYGGRGIKVCERWEKFENFYEDMGDVPDGRTIDRIDNDGDYEPSNCRWATSKEQARNRVSNRLMTYKGETKILTEWAEIFGISSHTLRGRVVELGWSDEEALTRPVGKYKRDKAK